MKNFISVFLFLPCLCFSQTDFGTVQHDSVPEKKFGFQLVIPTEFNGVYYLKNHSSKSAYSPLLENNKSLGWGIQALSAELSFKDRWYVELAFNYEGTDFEHQKALKQIQQNYPGYYVEEQHDNSTHNGDYALKYFRLGLGYNIYLFHYTYLKPYACFDIGGAELPTGKYGFKDNASNNFFVNDYNHNNLLCSGFNIGISSNRYFSSEDAANLGFWGIRLEYSQLAVKGKSEITHSVLFQNDVTAVAPIKKTFQYVAVGIFIGFGSKKDKRD